MANKSPRFQFGNAFEENSKPTLASPLDRLAAIVVDALILLPLVQLIQSPLKRELLRSLAFEDVSATLSWRFLNLSILIFVFWIYNTFSIYFFSQTVGKKVFGLRVVSFRSQVSLYASGIRSLTFFVEWILLGLPFIAVFTHPWRRPYHDRLSDTLVVSTNRPVDYPSFAEKRKAYIFMICFILSLSLSSLFYLYVSMHTTLDELLVGMEEKKCQSFEDGSDQSVANAIKQFTIQGIGADCLKKIAKESLWKNQDKALANLANSFAYHEQDELSQAYLRQVCEVDRGRACHFSRWVMKNPIEVELDKATIDSILASKNVEDFYKIYFISAFQAHGMHIEAQEVIAQVSDAESISNFLSLATFKALMGQEKWESAYWIYKSHNLEENNLVEFLEKANEDKSVNRHQLMIALEQFYPTLKEKKSRRPATVTPIPVSIRGMWMRLRERR